MQKRPSITDVQKAYGVLHLLPPMPFPIVRLVYRELAKLYHPDKGGTSVIMQSINAAYKLIESEERREALRKRREEARVRMRRERRRIIRRPTQE
jgi:curved DNA-binding protein CbpA